MPPPYLTPDPASTPQAPACFIAIKAVPGSSRDQIVGPLGDRLKVKVAAPPEDGKANKSIQALLAKALGVTPRDITLVSGPTHPEKVFRVQGLSADTAATRLS